jgi:hypothetical protein
MIPTQVYRISNQTTPGGRLPKPLAARLAYLAPPEADCGQQLDIRA